MPDALSKTVPIWCAVINSSITGGEQWGRAYLANESVSAQEASYVNDLIPSFVKSFKVVNSDVREETNNRRVVSTRHRSRRYWRNRSDQYSLHQRQS